MSAVKWYVIFHCLMWVFMVIGITACVIHFNNCHLMWWYLLPALGGGLTVTSEKGGAK